MENFLAEAYTLIYLLASQAWNSGGFIWFLKSFLDRDLKTVSIQIPPRSAQDGATADSEDAINRDDDDDDGEGFDGDMTTY